MGFSRFHSCIDESLPRGLLLPLPIRCQRLKQVQIPAVAIVVGGIQLSSHVCTPISHHCIDTSTCTSQFLFYENSSNTTLLNANMASIIIANTNRILLKIKAFANMSSPFLGRLPLELREIIYEEVLRSERLLLGPNARDRYTRSPLLRVCRAIRKEARPIFSAPPPLAVFKRRPDMYYSETGRRILCADMSRARRRGLRFYGWQDLFFGDPKVMRTVHRPRRRREDLQIIERS